MLKILMLVTAGCWFCGQAAAATQEAGLPPNLVPPALPAGAQAGDLAPDYLGISRDNDEVRVSHFQGKALVVTFWASWCGVCVKELPIVEAVRRKWGSERVEVVGVNFHEDSAAWRKAMSRLKGFTMTFTRDRDRASSEAYGVHSLPHVFMIDKNGRIAHTHTGYDESLLPTFVDEINELVVQELGARQ